MTIFNYAKRTTRKVTAWRAGRYDHIGRAMRAGMYDHVVQPKVSKGHAIQKKKIERVEHNTCRW